MVDAEEVLFVRVKRLFINENIKKTDSRSRVSLFILLISFFCERSEILLLGTILGKLGSETGK